MQCVCVLMRIFYRSKASETMATRKKIEAFLVVKFEKMSPIRLPQRIDVLRYFLYLKDKHGPSSANLRLISCPLQKFK